MFYSKRLSKTLFSAVITSGLYANKISLILPSHSNLCFQIVSGLILPAVINEFHFDGPFLKLGQNVGLLVGAVFWGLGSDVWGRKISFNSTLFILGVFATAAGGANDYVALCSFAAIWSIGVGGNLPVDSAIFLGMYCASRTAVQLSLIHINCRVHSCITSISSYCPVYLVGVWSTTRQFGAFWSSPSLPFILMIV